MKPAVFLTLLFVCLAPAWGANMIPGNAARGAEVVKAKSCQSCHAIDGMGGQAAPDLAKSPGGRFTPVNLATAMWNHGTGMSAAMSAAGMDAPELSHQEAADLFAYLYGFRHYEDPGDAESGKQTFDSKGCIGCHAQGAGGALPVMKWESVNDPIQLSRAMWNHAARMKSAMNETAAWPELTAQEMTDLLAYVRGANGAPKAPTALSAASAETGQTLFSGNGCAGCHEGSRSLEGMPGARTMVDLAAAMWNHAPAMRQSSEPLRPEEMTRLVGYLWSIQYFDGPGDSANGLDVAVAKGCVSCHGDPNGSYPRFTSLSGELDAIRFISGAWNHSAGMQGAMEEAGQEWPSLSSEELTDVIAYINSL